jgi:uncharacterized protein YlxW (UPF0749 family)
MKDMDMDEKASQKRMDTDTARLRQMIRRYGKLADDLCESGQTEQSAIVREMVGYLNLAFAKGRMIECTVDDGVITPQFGGK